MPGEEELGREAGELTGRVGMVGSRGGSDLIRVQGISGRSCGD